PRAHRNLAASLKHLDSQMRGLERSVRAEMAVLEGRLPDARRLLSELLASVPLDNRYAWPAIWQAMRVEADLAVQARERRTEPDPEHHERVRAITDLARGVAGGRPRLVPETTMGSPPARSRSSGSWPKAGATARSRPTCTSA